MSKSKSNRRERVVHFPRERLATERSQMIVFALAFGLTALLVSTTARAGSYTPRYEHLTKNRDVRVTETEVKIVDPDWNQGAYPFTRIKDPPETIINRRNMYYLDRKGSFPNTELLEIDQRSSSRYFNASLTKIENNAVTSATSCLGYRDESVAKQLVTVVGSTVKGYCVTVTPAICDTAKSILGQALLRGLDERMSQTEVLSNLSKRLQTQMATSDYKKLSEANKAAVERTYWKFRRPERGGKPYAVDTSQFADLSQFDKIVSACEDLLQKTEPQVDSPILAAPDNANPSGAKKSIR